jgi:nucleotide-binding universal stress UspA family protein
MLNIDRILCPVDFSESSARAYDHAQSLAGQYHAKLFLQHVVEFLVPSDAYIPYAGSAAELFESVRVDARRKLQDFANSHTGNGVPPECLLDEGTAPEAILSCAKAQEVNLIVMGAHGLKGLDPISLGSVTEKVLRKARCPVLVIPKPGDDVAELIE